MRAAGVLEKPGTVTVQRSDLRTGGSAAPALAPLSIKREHDERLEPGRPRRNRPYAVLMRRLRLSTRSLTPVGAMFPADTDPEAFMADIIFLLLGLGAFALFGLYAALLRKV